MGLVGWDGTGLGLGLDVVFFTHTHNNAILCSNWKRMKRRYSFMNRVECIFKSEPFRSLCYKCGVDVITLYAWSFILFQCWFRMRVSWLMSHMLSFVYILNLCHLNDFIFWNNWKIKNWMTNSNSHGTGANLRTTCHVPRKLLSPHQQWK